MSKYERYEQEKSKLELMLITGAITPEQYEQRIKKLAEKCKI